MQKIYAFLVLAFASHEAVVSVMCNMRLSSLQSNHPTLSIRPAILPLDSCLLYSAKLRSPCEKNAPPSCRVPSSFRFSWYVHVLPLSFLSSTTKSSEHCDRSLCVTSIETLSVGLKVAFGFRMLAHTLKY